MDNLIIDFNQFDELTYIIEPGNYDRIYVKNAHSANIRNCCVKLTGTVNTMRGILIENCGKLNIFTDELSTKFIGGIQVSGDIKDLLLFNLHVLGGDHGLLMSQHNGVEEYGHVYIENCMFSHHRKEGIYIGKSLIGNELEHEKPPIIDQVTISQTICRQNLWDGCQVGNAKTVEISDCEFIDNGLAEYDWQDYDLTINPGCERVDISRAKYKTAQFLHTDKIFIR